MSGQQLHMGQENSHANALSISVTKSVQRFLRERVANKIIILIVISKIKRKFNGKP